MSAQLGRLLNHLERNGGITQLEAFNALGITRLSERVREMEKLGYVIEHEPVKVPTRDNKLVRVTRYKLVQGVLA
jgi:DNA-binding Lrp family transcriptional regulator